MAAAVNVCWQFVVCPQWKPELWEEETVMESMLSDSQNVAGKARMYDKSDNCSGTEERKMC